MDGTISDRVSSAETTGSIPSSKPIEQTIIVVRQRVLLSADHGNSQTGRTVSRSRSSGAGSVLTETDSEVPLSSVSPLSLSNSEDSIETLEL